jgi:hypothetical protein
MSEFKKTAEGTVVVDEESAIEEKEMKPDVKVIDYIKWERLETF